MGSIIAELLTRAQELGLASQPVAQLMGGMRGGLAVNEGQFWRDSFATLLSALQAHLNALLRINQVCASHIPTSLHCPTCLGWAQLSKNCPSFILAS